jgi:hypothetical protein
MALDAYTSPELGRCGRRRSLEQLTSPAHPPHHPRTRPPAAHRWRCGRQGGRPAGSAASSIGARNRSSRGCRRMQLRAVSDPVLQAPAPRRGDLPSPQSWSGCGLPDRDPTMIQATCLGQGGRGLAAGPLAAVAVAALIGGIVHLRGHRGAGRRQSGRRRQGGGWHLRGRRHQGGGR